MNRTNHTAGYEGIFGGSATENPLPYPYETSHASTEVPAVGPMDYPIPGCSRNLCVVDPSDKPAGAGGPVVEAHRLVCHSTLGSRAF